MPIHSISDGDVGLALYNGGGAPITFRKLFMNDGSGPGGYLEFAQLWRCTSSNFDTGVFSWVQFAQTDKYRPTVGPASISLSQAARGGAPVVVSYSDYLGTPYGPNYVLNIIVTNITAGNSLSAALAIGRATSGTQSFALPAGWNSGDLIDASGTYQSFEGYAGPATSSSNEINLH